MCRPSGLEGPDPPGAEQSRAEHCTAEQRTEEAGKGLMRGATHTTVHPTRTPLSLFAPVCLLPCLLSAAVAASGFVGASSFTSQNQRQGHKMAVALAVAPAAGLRPGLHCAAEGEAQCQVRPGFRRTLQSSDWLVQLSSSQDPDSCECRATAATLRGRHCGHSEREAKRRSKEETHIIACRRVFAREQRQRQAVRQLSSRCSRPAAHPSEMG